MPTWQKFAMQSKELQTSIAEIDVTTSPSLTGVFLISHLPTIVHVNDGAVRTYTGARRPEDFTNFLKQKKWADIEPIPWYYSPSSFHMRILGYLLQISVYVRDIHSYLTDEKGFPSWLSYVTLGVGTLTIGVCVGLLCVLICDFFCPPRPQIKLLLGGKQEPPGSPLDSDMDDDSDVIDDGEASGADAAGDQGDEARQKAVHRGGKRAEEAEAASGDQDADEEQEDASEEREDEDESEKKEEEQEEKAAEEEEEEKKGEEQEEKAAEKEEEEEAEKERTGRRARRRKE